MSSHNNYLIVNSMSLLQVHLLWHFPKADPFHSFFSVFLTENGLLTGLNLNQLFLKF